MDGHSVWRRTFPRATLCRSTTPLGRMHAIAWLCFPPRLGSSSTFCARTARHPIPFRSINVVAASGLGPRGHGSTSGQQPARHRSPYSRTKQSISLPRRAFPIPRTEYAKGALRNTTLRWAPPPRAPSLSCPGAPAARTRLWPLVVWLCGHVNT